MALKLKINYKGYEAEYFSIRQVFQDKTKQQTTVSLALFKDEATSRETDNKGFRIGLRNFLKSEQKEIDGINLSFVQIYEALKLPKLVDGININPLTSAIDC